VVYQLSLYCEVWAVCAAIIEENGSGAIRGCANGGSAMQMLDDATNMNKATSMNEATGMTQRQTRTQG
jgi:hypothetical protein